MRVMFAVVGEYQSSFLGEMDKKEIEGLSK